MGCRNSIYGKRAVQSGRDERRETRDERLDKQVYIYIVGMERKRELDRPSQVPGRLVVAAAVAVVLLYFCLGLPYMPATHAAHTSCE